ncbi:hypothetical protein OROMI_026526 [Orobanche minor]
MNVFGNEIAKLLQKYGFDSAKSGRQDSSGADRPLRPASSVILLIFNIIGDVKVLGQCCVVSRRFHYLFHQVDDAFVRVDCVISDDDPSSTSSPSSGSSAASYKPPPQI